MVNYALTSARNELPKRWDGGLSRLSASPKTINRLRGRDAVNEQERGQTGGQVCNHLGAQ